MQNFIILSRLNHFLNSEPMKKSVKSLVLITISLLGLCRAGAQLKLPSLSPLCNDIRKVVEDYPNQFGNLRGEIIVDNTQSVDYQCNFNVTGAEEATITRYSSKKNNVYSWQATMLTTEDFEEARKKFKSLFGQLNNLAIRPAGANAYNLKGRYESPTEDKKFTTVVFSCHPDDESVRKLKVELTMQYIEPMEWKVKIMVYEKEREDDERGVIKE